MGQDGPWHLIDIDRISLCSLWSDTIYTPLTFHLPTSAMPSVFTHEFDTLAFKGKVSFDTGIFINGQFVDGSDLSTIE